jgi:VWFA-related protein
VSAAISRGHPTRRWRIIAAKQIPMQITLSKKVFRTDPGYGLHHVPALCFLALIVCTCCAAQEPGVAQPATPTIQMNVNKVLVPVVVRDKQGRVVAGLKLEDFQVFDNEKPRQVSALTIENRAGQQEPTRSSADTAPQPPSLQSAAALSRPRFIIILFDDFHLDVEDLARTKKAAEKLLDGALLDTDYAAVVSISGKTNSGLVRDRSKLQAALASLQSHSLYKSGSTDCPNIDYYQADLIENKHSDVATQDAVRKVLNCSPSLDPKYQLNVAANEADAAAKRALAMGHQDVQATYATIAAVVHGMSTLPGQRTLLLVSPGFLRIEQDAQAAESRIMDLAAQSNVTISAIDARGLYTMELSASERSPALSGPSFNENSDYRRSAMTQAEDAMAELANATGGTFFHNSNDLDAGFKAVTEAPEMVYVLELSLDNVKADGAPHRLKVKVDREGVEIQARRSYVLPKPEKIKK